VCTIWVCVQQHIAIFMSTSNCIGSYEKEVS
jgi:hypothetical protein